LLEVGNPVLGLCKRFSLRIGDNDTFLITLEEMLHEFAIAWEGRLRDSCQLILCRVVTDDAWHIKGLPDLRKLLVEELALDALTLLDLIGYKKLDPIFEL